MRGLGGIAIELDRVACDGVDGTGCIGRRWSVEVIEKSCWRRERGWLRRCIETPRRGAIPLEASLLPAVLSNRESGFKVVSQTSQIAVLEATDAIEC